MTGVWVESAGATKGSVDLREAVVCQYGVCVLVFTVGVCADNLSIATSFILGPNIFTISIGAKTFVWCCKISKFPWGGWEL